MFQAQLSLLLDRVSESPELFSVHKVTVGVKFELLFS